MITAILLGALSSAVLLFAGYLWGSGRNRRLLAQMRTQAPGDELKRLEALVARQEAQAQNLEREIRERLQRSTLSSDDLKNIVAPLVAQGDRQNQLDLTLKRLIQPLLEREARETEVGRVGGNARKRGEIPQLLAALVSRADLEHAALVDADGLPLATTANPETTDIVAAAAALLGSISERLVAAGASATVTAVLTDDTGRNTLYRFFRVRDQPYVLIAASHNHLNPRLLDPALPRIEQLLADEAWNQDPSERPGVVA